MSDETRPRGLARRVNALRLFFFVAMNCDLGVFAEIIRTGRAAVSQSGLKRLCAPGLNCYSCPSAVLSCPMGALQFWLNASVERRSLGENITMTGLYVVGFIVALGALGGRVWCGLVCPFGAVQEWLSRMFGEGRNHPLPCWAKYVKYGVLVVFVLALPLAIVDGLSLGPTFCKLICPSGTLFAGIPLVALDPGLRDAISWISLLKVLVLVAVLVALIFTRRFFCKVACPLGALWSLGNRTSILRLELDPSRCDSCGACERACPMHVDPRNDINSPECVRCLVCSGACPKKAIGLKGGLR